MNGTMVILNLLGGVALLLWGLRMVETGVNAAFGADLRRWIGRGMRHPPAGWLVGLGVTAIMQSSTATAVITMSFARQGLMGTAQALAVMLGADVGTSLVVQVLSFDLSWFSPLLILVGVICYKTGRVASRQQFSRALIGVGLILLALRLLLGASQPLASAPAFQQVLITLAGEPLLLLILGALVAWAAHSSLAIVLLVAFLAGGGGVSLPAAFALVLGANVGNGITPILITLGASPEVRRIPFGNLGFKLCGAMVLVFLLPWLPGWLAPLGADSARQVAHFHTAFNLGLSAVFLFLTRPAASLLERWLPEAPAASDQGLPRYLDPNAIENPTLALANAERESLRMGDLIERMLSRSLHVIRTNDELALQEIDEAEKRVDALNSAIKFYLTDLSRESMNERDSRRTAEIFSFTINLEHIGDIIDNNLMDLAGKKIRNRLHFSDEGYQDIAGLHRRLMDNLKLSFGVFMSGEVEMARSLLQEKANFKARENQAAASHLERLRTHRIESIDTSSIHLDLLNEFKRINSHITVVAYPILEHAGELFTTRLKSRA